MSDERPPHRSEHRRTGAPAPPGESPNPPRSTSGPPELDAIPAPVLRFDGDGTLLYANPASEPLLREWQDGLAELCVPVIDDARDTGDTREVEVECDGRFFTLLFSPQTETGYVNVYGHDITERRLAESALRASQEQLAQVGRLEAVGKLAGGIAHDFNNLLMVIVGYSEELVDALGDDVELGEKTRQIRRAAERAEDLIRQLLAFSRKQPLRPRVVDLNELVRELDRMLTRLMPENIEIRYGLDDGLGPVMVDPGQVEQILINLAVNAAAAMRQGGVLRIETCNVLLDDAYASRKVGVSPGRYVMIATTDTGCGMDPETMNRVFEPFFTTKERSHGTGLGLATVYGIVKQSGGNVWVYSERGFGTTFKVYLPRFEGEMPEIDEEPALGEIPPGDETVLVVEDEDGVRELICEFLTGNGFKVLEASNPSDALRICDEHAERIELLLTDVVMPEMDGQELAQRVRRKRAGLRVLFMSGYSADSLGDHGVLTPDMILLQKPFTSRTLARKLHEVLGRPLDPG